MSQNSSGNQQPRPDLRKLDFTLKPRFTNTLPDIPFEGKFMPCPFVPISRFVEYKTSAIEKDYKHEVICDDDMGLDVDLIDLDIYDQDTEQHPFDEKDLILLEDDNNSKLSQKRSAQHSRLVPWMRKTEYISTEYNRFGLTADRQETKLGYNLKKKQQVDDMYRDRQSQIDAINKTFEDVKKPITQHYSKKGVHAIEECYVFPDFENWKHLLVHVQFDGDNVNTNLPEGLRKTAAEMSLIRGMQYENEQFAAHFVPSVENMQKQMDEMQEEKEFDEDEKYDYTLSREYMWKWEPKNKGEPDNFLMHWKNGRVCYDEIDSSVKMIRRRDMHLSKKSKLFVKFRDFDESEIGQMERRFENLFKPAQSEKDIEEEEEEEEEKHESGSDGSEDDDEDDNKQKKEKSSASSGSESGSGIGSSDDEKEKKKSKKKAVSSGEEDESD